MYKIGNFGKSILTLGIGTSAAQALSLFFYPILGRLYSPKEFGLLATITVISSIIVVIATGRYEQAILIAKTKKEAANILGLSILFSIFVCLIFTIIFICTASPLADWLNAPDLNYWIIVVPIISFFIVVYNCYNEWCVKHSLFSQLSVNKVLNSLSINLSKVFCGICGMLNGLVLGEMIGRGLSATLCAGSILRIDLREIAGHISRNEL
ncbi:MAG: oligosaccharide flippase family protein, partial [Bacteroidales bacterium]